jgi:hypothetical protein
VDAHHKHLPPSHRQHQAPECELPRHGGVTSGSTPSEQGQQGHCQSDA